MSRKVTNLDTSDLLKRYCAGESEKHLAECFGHSRNVIRRILTENGVAPRNRSEGMLARMKRTPPEERQRLASRAHAAVRGVRRTRKELLQRARTREAKRLGTDKSERLLESWLQERGITCMPQKAIGPYNVDLAIAEPPIAVEGFGGRWHVYNRYRSRFLRRAKHIRRAGYTQVIIWNDAKGRLDTGAADYIVALVQSLSKGESAPREQHVIWGNGKTTTRGSKKLNYGAIIAGL